MERFFFQFIHRKRALFLSRRKTKSSPSLSPFSLLSSFVGERAFLCNERERRDDENDALFAKSLSTRICDGKFSLHVGGIFFFVFGVVVLGDESSFSASDESRNGSRSDARSFFFVHRDCLSRGRAQTQRWKGR